MADTKYKFIADELETRMTRAQAGDRLPSQRSLMDEFGVSSRTIHKVFQLLKQRGVIAPSPRGTTVKDLPAAPRRNPRFYLFSMGKATDLKSDPLHRRIWERALQDGFEPVFLAPIGTVVPDWDALDCRPGDAAIFAYSSFRSAWLEPLHRCRMPFVVGNRVPENIPVNWVDWNHLELFDNLISELVTRGAREIGVFPTRSVAGDVSNIVMEVADFKRAKRSYSLYNNALDSFPDELLGDMASYADFLKGLKRLPDVIVIFDPKARSGLDNEFRRCGLGILTERLRLLESLPVSGDRPGHAGFYSEAGYRKLADKMWMLLRHVIAHPDSAPCGLKQRCSVKYYDHFRKTRKIT